MWGVAMVTWLGVRCVRWGDAGVGWSKGGLKLKTN